MNKFEGDGDLSGMEILFRPPCPAIRYGKKRNSNTHVDAPGHIIKARRTRDLAGVGIKSGGKSVIFPL
jgi:hypothetical protein